MKYKLLKATNPALDIEHLLDLVALYRGGKCFRERIARFLPKNEFEEDARYELRKQQAPYRSYVGPIIDKFAASLISAPPSGQVVDEQGAQSDPDEFWTEWRANVDGNGTDLSEFFREQFSDALMKKRSLWSVTAPSDEGVKPASKAEFDERGLGNVVLKELETQDVLDWEADKSGALKWLIHRECERKRNDPRKDSRDKITERFTIYDREAIEVFEIEYEPGKEPQDEADIPSVSRQEHSLGQVPVVVLEMPAGLAVAERIEDNQVEHFRLNAALSWAIKTTCYAMPVFKLIDGNNPPSFGAGKGIILDALDEIDWLAPPVQQLGVIAEKILAEKDEIYRVVHQMADGVNNNASAVGRSADSKAIDSMAMRVIMESYSVLLRDAVQRTYELAAAWRGEKLNWTVTGLDNYDDIDLGSLLEAATQVNGIGVPSETFEVQMSWLIVDSLLPNLDEKTRTQIHTEIQAGIKQKLKEKEEDRQHELEARENEAMLAHALNRTDPRGMNGPAKPPGGKRPPDKKKAAPGGGGGRPSARP